MMKRRQWLGGLAVGGAAGCLDRGEQAVAASVAPDSAGQPQRSCRLVHFTDAHVHPGRSAPQGLAAAIEHVRALDDPPDFILNGGDAIGDALEVGREEVEQQWRLWHSAWQEHAALPVRHCLGNHDIWGWNKTKSQTRGSESGWGKTLALEQLQLERSYYRFDQAGWRFVILDSLTFDEETAYRAELDREQFEWLAAELTNTPREMPLVIVSHIPILTVGGVGFARELRQQPQGSRMLSHQDGLELLMLLRQYPNVKLCLSGHTHLTERVEFGGLGFVNSGAVSGLWWKGHFLHTSEGYNLVDLYDDGSYQTRYISYGWQAAGTGQR